MLKLYYHDAKAIIIVNILLSIYFLFIYYPLFLSIYLSILFKVYDVSQISSFNSIEYWLNELKDKATND
jgi:hypothetical protein